MTEFINIKEQTPSSDDFGTEFLCAVKYNGSGRYKYEIAEWTEPRDENEQSYFNIDVDFCGQITIKTEVTHWCKLLELPEQETNMVDSNWTNKNEAVVYLQTRLYGLPSALQHTIFDAIWKIELGGYECEKVINWFHQVKKTYNNINK